MISHSEDAAAVRDGGPDVDALRAMGEALQRSESHFKEVLERSPEVALVLREGRVVYVNPAMARAAGAASAEALLGREAVELLHPAYRSIALERMTAVAATNVAAEPREVRCQRDDGADLWTENIIVPMTFDGKPAMLVLGRDVTARRRQGDQLREAEEKFRLAFDHAPIGMALTSLEGRWLQVNRALCDLVGYSVDELLARTVRDITHPDDEATGEEVPVDHGSQSGMCKRYLHKDGSVVEVTLHLSVVRDADGAPVHVINQMLDVTAQRRAESARREADRRARMITSHVPVGIYETDLEGRCTFVNDRWIQLTGYAAEKIVGLSWNHLVHPDDLERVSAEWLASQREGREFAVEYRYRTADDRTVWVLCTAAGMFDEAGRAVGYLGTVLDVSERKRAQVQLLFNDRMAAVGTLASGVAHEINNPLSYITANLDLIVEEVRSLAPQLAADRVREIEELASEGRQGTEKVRRIVRALKTFARADEEHRVRLDVHSVLDLSISIAASELHRRARVVRDYQWVPAVEADEARLGQVFINLLLNAAQALPEGMSDRHTIRIVTRTDPAGRVIIEVHDTGVGIAPEHRQQIFDPFFTTRPVGRAVGLGLSICHGIVTALGGEITVASEPGRGSTFTVSLPGVAVEAIPEGAPQRITEVRKRDGRILVVDDDPMVGITLRRVLDREHEVTVCESGREALTLIGAGERYDVILCDVMMPQMTGIELHAELGHIAADQQERMIFVTGGTFTPTVRAFFDRAPNALIEKPFNLRNLRAVVREQLHLLRAGVGAEP